MKNYLEAAEKKAGSQKKLAEMLGITASYIRMVKANKKGLPEATCIQIADYINENPLKVMLASSLITEKNEERRKILQSCFTRAANFAVVASVISVLTLPSQSPTHAAENRPTVNNINYQ